MKKIINVLTQIFLSSLIFSQIQISNPLDAITIGLQNDKEYSLAKEKGLKEKYLSSRAVSDFLPALNINFSQGESKNYNASDIRSKSLQLALSQKIFNGGKTKISYEMQKINADYEYLNQCLNETSFIKKIVESYFSLLVIERSLKTKSELLDNAKVQLEICKKEWELGLTLETDYLEYQISFFNIEESVNQVQRQLKSILHNFKILLGIDESEKVLVYGNQDSIILNEKEIEKYSDNIFNISKEKNIALKKSLYDLELLIKQYRYNNLIYFPQIFLESDLTFSGDTYPLTQPEYSLRLSFQFDKLPLLSPSFSTNTGFDKYGLKSISASSGSSLNTDLTYWSKKNISKMDLELSKIRYEKQIIDFKEEIKQKVISHDELLTNIKVLNEKIYLQKKRLIILEEEVNKGERNRIDYLQALQESSEDEISLLRIENQLQLFWYELEILTNCSIGELKNVCEY